MDGLFKSPRFEAQMANGSLLDRVSFIAYCLICRKNFN